MKIENDFIDKRTKPVLMAIIAAALYGISSPISKLLLQEVPPTLMASMLYLGAGIGMLVVNGVSNLKKTNTSEAKMTREELPYILAMILLDIAAPVFLMFGLSKTTSENAALLNNFEIVATSVIALLIFKEAIGKRMWLAITLITISSMVLTVNNNQSFSFSPGSILVLLACICWGFENNCTRKLSLKDPRQIVVVKGLGSGIGALFIAILSRQFSNNILYLFLTMMLGFVAYGLSIYFYILAQRDLGAARTSTYYAAAPFIGVVISWIIFRDRITWNFLVALLIMLLGTFYAVTELHRHKHLHEEVTHEHKHSHADGHHIHTHEEGFQGEHTHVHQHEAVVHNHTHTPDIHHTHTHKNNEV